MYQALYRKWRPRTFDDVISQPHITTVLQHQLKEDKTAHAYLFTGSRGTGKTTCARILAKACNCLNRRPDGNPCLECEICRDAEAGTISDIVEIDAASNSSVDDIRELRDATVYLPERSRYKVYIIDEVHMLSPTAWGALLKIMEEPPAYVKFILATTEIHKVPATIISRCQRYDFHRIRTVDIAARLTYIAQQEQLSLSEQSAQLIAHLSDGGMRDALSLLDQCATGGEEITPEIVNNAAGVAGRDYVFQIIESIQKQDAGSALTIVGALYDLSKNMVKLCDEIIEQLRNIMLVRSKTAKEDLLTCLPDELPRVEHIAHAMDLQTILTYISKFQKCRERMQHHPGKRVELEMTILELSVPRQVFQPVQVAQPVSTAQPVAPVQPIQQPVAPVVSQPAEHQADTSAVSTATQPQKQAPLSASDFKAVPNWADILAEYRNINPAVSGALVESTAFVAGNIMLIVAKNKFFLSLLKNKENALSLRKTAKRFLGVDYIIKAKCDGTEEQQQSIAQKLIKNAIDSGIETTVE